MNKVEQYLTKSLILNSLEYNLKYVWKIKFQFRFSVLACMIKDILAILNSETNVEQLFN